jgi:hypothetical protein
MLFVQFAVPRSVSHRSFRSSEVRVARASQPVARADGPEASLQGTLLRFARRPRLSSALGSISKSIERVGFVSIQLSQRRRRIVAALGCAAVAGCAKSKELEIGQIWSYDNRAGEQASTIQILHIEKGTPVGDVIFVSVRALDVKRLGRRIRTTEVWPLVFTREALTASLKSYQWSEKVNRPYLKYLDLWWKETREGRVDDRTFRVPIKEALAEIEAERPGADKRSFSEV